MDLSRCIAVINRADEMAVKLYDEASEISERSLRVRSEEYASLLEDSANVIRELASALRVAAAIALQKADC